MRPVTCGVYFLFDGDELVYIGKSNNIYLRIGEHIKEGTKNFDRFEIYPTLDFDLLEGFLIYTLKPKYNVAQGCNGWMGRNACDDCFPTQSIQEAIDIYNGMVPGYTADDIEKLIGVTRQCVLSYLQKHEKEIPCYKKDGRWYIARKWVEENSWKLCKYYYE